MDDYSQKRTVSATLRGEPLHVVTRAGLAGGPAVDDAAILAARLVTPAPTERALLLGCGHGALAVALARQMPAGQLTLSDPSALALDLATRTLAANGTGRAETSPRVSQLPEGAGTFDRVILMVPRSRALGRRWLVEALALLRPGGLLNLAGANSGGVQPLIADAAALFGAAAILGYGRGCRVAEAMRPAVPPPTPPWAIEPGIAPGTWHLLWAELPGGRTELASLPGIFSYDRVDAGTTLLLQHTGPCQGLRVLDAGCGYGPIGVAATQLGAAQVDMLDVNLLAVAAARENIARLDLRRAAAHPSDALEAARGRRYDLVLSNPPFHAGKEVDTATAGAFISQARAVLEPGGRLMLVANRFLTYERQMAPWFSRVTVAAQSSAYRVLAGEV